MNALRLARAYGVCVSFADLGDWGKAELRSEYDPHIPVIRINARVARRFKGEALREFIMLAVGHELYHHRERIGATPSLAGTRAREDRAERYARRLLDRA